MSCILRVSNICGAWCIPFQVDSDPLCCPNAMLGAFVYLGLDVSKRLESAGTHGKNKESHVGPCSRSAHVHMIHICSCFCYIFFAAEARHREFVREFQNRVSRYLAYNLRFLFCIMSLLYHFAFFEWPWQRKGRTRSQIVWLLWRSGGACGWSLTFARN